MLKSAEYFMAGFLGLEWANNVTLEPIIEQLGYNNSLAGYYKCNNSEDYHSTGGNNASLIWENIYLADATQRFKSAAGGYNWTVADTYNAQTLCPYETVSRDWSVVSVVSNLVPRLPMVTRNGATSSRMRSGKVSSTALTSSSTATMASARLPAEALALVSWKKSMLAYKGISTIFQTGAPMSTRHWMRCRPPFL